jgi:cell division protein FtsI/penicillin-binding protein 2
MQPFMRSFSILRFLSILIALTLLPNVGFGATRHSHGKRTRKTAIRRVVPAKRRSSARVIRASYVRTPRRAVAAPGPVVRGGPWTEPTYADSTSGDYIDGEDMDVRRAAVSALGPYNGSIVVVDPSSGRILSMVNQKLALGSGFQPCSTIKVWVALAALSERIISSPTDSLRIFRRGGINLTQALAHSNNSYFANLGIKLGYDRVSRYAHLFGYGEKAGLNINGEQSGRFPDAPPRNGGVGMLTSFGEEISQTPLQLAALMSAIANGGTLYYLQYPRSQADVEHFEPRIKRHLEISKFIPAVKPGMLGAVEFGTARRAQPPTPVAGKTGTCTDSRTHLGWFGSFNDLGPRKLVVVVLLTGGKPAIGPQAAGIAGQVYRSLAEKNYFARGDTVTPASLISTQICCTR